jgi:hypothetical protein
MTSLTLCESARPATAHREFAIECVCSHRSEAFQLAFARKAIEVLPQCEEIALEPTHAGLKVLAETELAFEQPLARLREVYEGDLRVTPPAVRYRRGEVVEEPHMGLRVLCAPTHFPGIKRDLLMRGAQVLDAELNARFGVLRAAASLVQLVGYPARIRQMTSDRARLWMWLSHYAPVERIPPPGGEAA